MKKLDISSQLIVLFFAILLVASCVFSITTMGYAKNIASKETYNRLTSYALIIDNSVNEENAKNNDNMGIGYYIKTKSDASYQNLEIYNNLLCEDDILSLVNQIKENNKGKDEYITQIEKFIRDRQNTDYFLQKFIIDSADVLLCVVNKLNLSYSFISKKINSGYKIIQKFDN